MLIDHFFFCILFVFGFLQFLQVCKIHHKFLKEKKERKKKKEASRVDINNKLVQLLFYQLKEGFPFVVMDLKFIILSGYKTFYLKRTLNSFEKGFKG